MTRVLVTGATGFIGRHTLARLRERGFDVVEAASADADLLDAAQAERLVAEARPTHLLHLAWYAEHGRFWTSPENLRWVEASLRLLRAFADAGGRRAVMAGTGAEYDWSEGGVLSERSSPLAPATLYGAAKHGLHVVARPFCERVGVSLAWGRVFFPYGPHEHPDRLVASVARALLAGEEAPTSEGSQVRDFMHVEDVAGAFAALVGSDVEGAVNVASGEPVTVWSVVEQIARAAGRPELVRRGALPAREGEPAELVAEARRLREEVGFRPQRSLADGIAQTVEWWRTRT